jgi:type I restriction enzyme S subunit
MSFPRYPAYKDSGVEWLGEVPEDWEITRIASILRKAQDEGREDLPVLSVSIHHGVTDSELGEDEMDRKVTRIEDRTRYLRVLPGDLVYNTMRAWQGGFGTVSVEGLVSPAYVVARPIRSFQTRLVEHQLRTPQAVEEMRRHSQGVTDFRLRLYWDEFKHIQIVLPPLREQIAIAAFLDCETAKIDALVADYRALIELLREKRQAVISHAVTKSLDPSVPMKDSGVEWLEEVPEHWDVAPLKYLVSMQSGGTPSKDNLDYWNGDVPWASSKDMKAEYLWDTTDHVTQVAIEAGAVALVPAGSILVVVRGMILARAFPVAAIAVPMAINQDLKALQTTDRVAASYLACCLKASEQESRRRIDEAGHGTKALRMDAWTSMELPVPPLTEQTAIATFLDHETARIDSLISDAQEAITLLQERRTALISAAVTGKIDVRGLVAIPENELVRSCG